MKGRVIALGQFDGRAAAALIVDGKLDDFLIDPDNDTVPAPGTIFRAICDRPLKGQGGMMLRLPGGSAFLRGASARRPGSAAVSSGHRLRRARQSRPGHHPAAVQKQICHRHAGRARNQRLAGDQGRRGAAAAA